MSDDESPPFYTEDPRALLNLACGSRPDWSREETWRAIHAAKNAGMPYPAICKRIVSIAFREDGSPAELRDEVANGRPVPSTGPVVYERGAALARELLENRGERDGGTAA